MTDSTALLEKDQDSANSILSTVWFHLSFSRSRAIACLITICLFQFQPGFSRQETAGPIDSELIASGQQALQEGNAAKALELFNSAARKRPDSPEAHLGRACSLMKLGRKAEAIKEYKLVLLFNPSQAIAKKAESALASCGIKAEKEESAEISTNVAPPTVRRQDVEASIKDIQQQSEDRIQGIHSDSESTAHSIYNAKMSAHNRLMERLRQEEAEMRQARIRIGRRLIPAYGEDEIREIFTSKKMKSYAYLNKAHSDYAAAKHEAENRALGIKASAEGLQSQMINKPSDTSGVFLLPKGTNLYVRNYAHFDPVLPEPPVPLMAVPLKLPQLVQMEAAAKKHNKTSGPKAREKK